MYGSKHSNNGKIIEGINFIYKVIVVFDDPMFMLSRCSMSVCLEEVHGGSQRNRDVLYDQCGNIMPWFYPGSL